MLSRRAFVSWLSGLGAALGFGVRARTVEAKSSGEVTPEQGAALDSAMLSRIAEVVLPSELGTSGFDRVSRAFTQWAGAYQPGVELVHPYGSTTLRKTGESPTTRWREQLVVLDREARQKHQRAFTALTLEQRRDLVTTAISAERTNRMPDPLDAGHVALALVGWYFATPDAIDLCYRSRIGKNQCRPLVNAPRQPLPLRDGGQGTGDGRGRTS